jgi:hypothetical protein
VQDANVAYSRKSLARCAVLGAAGCSPFRVERASGTYGQSGTATEDQQHEASLERRCGRRRARDRRASVGAEPEWWKFDGNARPEPGRWRAHALHHRCPAAGIDIGGAADAPSGASGAPCSGNARFSQRNGRKGGVNGRYDRATEPSGTCPHPIGGGSYAAVRPDARRTRRVS